MLIWNVIDQREELEQPLKELLSNNDTEQGFSWIPVLVPTEENTDYNGSNFTINGDLANFTYRDATEEDVYHATSAGYWECFGEYTYDTSIYTGNQYDINGISFPAIVLDPPAYAREVFF